MSIKSPSLRCNIIEPSPQLTKLYKIRSRNYTKTPKLAISGLELEYFGFTILQLLKRLKYLRTLELDFSYTKDYWTAIPPYFIKFTNLVKKLKKFRVNFSFCYDLQDIELNDLANSLKNLSYASELDINLSSCYQVDSKTLSKLFYQLKSAHQLKKIGINLLECSQIEKENILRMYQSIRPYQVTDLSLNLTCCEEVDDDYMNILSQGLLRLKNIERLNFKSNRCIQITQDGFKVLNETLKKLSKLKSLTLNMRECYSITNGLATFSSTLAKLPQIEELDLDIFSWGSAFIEFKQFIESLPKTNLRSLTLDTSWCDSFDDKLLGELIQVAFQNKKLNRFNVNASLCPQITDKSLVYVRDQCKEYGNKVRDFKLTLNNCMGISDKGVLALGDIFTGNYLRNIRDLKFSFLNCPSVSMYAANKLKSVLSQTRQQASPSKHLNRSHAEIVFQRC